MVSSDRVPPLLMVYFVTYGETSVVIPIPFRYLLASPDNKIVDLGIFYYCFMAALCVFCTNSINIVAGVNGVEGGQSLVLAISIAISNLYQIATTQFSTTREAQLNSLYFLLPFIGVTLGYLKHNW